MEVDLFILARHAEVQGELLNVLGAGWDSVTVHDVAEDLPDGAITVVSGALVARILCHQITETNREHTFSVTLVDEDGGDLGTLGGGFSIARAAGIPVGWPQNMNIVLPLSLPLPRFGAYTFSLEVDGRHLADRAFRVIDGRSDAAGGLDAEAA